ncbi:HPP family protein, partial [Actinomadura napierensis]|uniref:HPP family protein n=1 Tax=Actinomadura napierensis TaxID=267854 RepID=UPI0031DF546A
MNARLRPVWATLVMLVPLAVVQAVVDEPLLAPPLAASAALLAVAPGTPAARASAVLAGHALSVAVGFAVARTADPGTVATTAGAGLAVAAMVLAGRFHAPAVASAALVGAGGAVAPAVALLAGALGVAA